MIMKQSNPPPLYTYTAPIKILMLINSFSPDYTNNFYYKDEKEYSNWKKWILDRFPRVKQMLHELEYNGPGYFIFKLQIESTPTEDFNKAVYKFTATGRTYPYRYLYDIIQEKELKLFNKSPDMQEVFKIGKTEEELYVASLLKGINFED